jgi:hypothetical protein
MGRIGKMGGMALVRLVFGVFRQFSHIFHRRRKKAPPISGKVFNGGDMTEVLEDG